MTTAASATDELQMLGDMPADHPLRNTPLLGANYRYIGRKSGRVVGPAWPIAKKTYNDLTSSWTDGIEFFFVCIDNDSRIG